MTKDMSEEKEYCKCTDDVACMPHQVVDGLHEKVKSLEQRLSQAEAESTKLKKILKRYTLNESTDSPVKIHYEVENEMLKARLSHLMDVAGKMAGALEDVIDADLLGGGLLEKVAISIAEWDGIKDGGK